MMLLCDWVRRATLVGCLVAVSWAAIVPASGQEPTYRPTTDFVPPSGMGMLLVRPQAWLGYPDFTAGSQWLMPHEVLAAWGKENLGMHPLAIAEVKAIIGIPIGAGPPQFGIVITTLEDFDPEKLPPDVVADSGPVQLQQRTLYPLALPDLPSELYLESVDRRTVLIGDRLMLQAMLDAKEGTGPLADLLRQNPPGNVDLQTLWALQPLRPLLEQVPHQVSPDTPAVLRELADGMRLLKAIGLRGKAVGQNSRLRLEILADDAAGAAELQRLIHQAVEYGKQELLNTGSAKLAELEPGPITDAWRVYYSRLVGQITELVQPTLAEDRVVLDATVPTSLAFASSGLVLGAMLPAVEAARSSAEQLQSSNNLKQIGLAMHNYHATFLSLPAAAITAADGTPLLSWRVAILPFIEQNQLYEQFKMDEPWDSEHNLQLLSQIPSIYMDPDLATPEARAKGLTSYHIPVGERYLFKPSGTTRFRDVTDGLSNTIMLLAGNESSLVPWTSPEYLPLDDDADRLEFFIQLQAAFQGFNIGFGDGSIHSIPLDGVTDELFERMLTRDGGEVIALP